MRRLFTVLAFLVLAVACLDRGGPPQELQLEISGMHCEDCAVALTESLRGIEGVLSAEVSLEDARARITVPSHRADALKPSLAAAVTGLGYGARWTEAGTGGSP